jgi:hypothetical protein
MSRRKSARALRLADISPPCAAALVTERVIADQEQARRALGGPPARMRPERTPVYARVHALARFAAYGHALPRRTAPSAEVRWVEGLLRLPRSQGEPEDMVEAVLLGALARERLARRLPLSAAELALLCGYDRDHVLALAAGLPGAYRSEREPRRPWRFQVNADLLAFLRGREAAAGTSLVA